MTTKALALTVLSAIVLVPTGAFAKDKHKDKHRDKHWDNHRGYESDYRSYGYYDNSRPYYRSRYYAPYDNCRSDYRVRYYSPYNCAPRFNTSGFWISIP